MDYTMQQALDDLKAGARIVNRMNGNIYLEMPDRTLQRISRSVLSQLKRESLIEREADSDNPFVRTYTLSNNMLQEA